MSQSRDEFRFIGESARFVGAYLSTPGAVAQRD